MLSLAKSQSFALLDYIYPVVINRNLRQQFVSLKFEKEL